MPTQGLETSNEQAVLGTPLVGRLEVGSITLPAHEWLRLEVGDVVSTEGAERTVAIRVGGLVVAWGELVTVDGSIGVRIERVAASHASPVEGT